MVGTQQLMTIQTTEQIATTSLVRAHGRALENYTLIREQVTRQVNQHLGKPTYYNNYELMDAMRTMLHKQPSLPQDAWDELKIANGQLIKQVKTMREYNRYNETNPMMRQLKERIGHTSRIHMQHFGLTTHMHALVESDYEYYNEVWEVVAQRSRSLPRAS